MVGSVNLYQANLPPNPEITNPLDAPFNHYHDHEDFAYWY